MTTFHDHEPVRGLPETPPEGERILWQGAPDWRRLARYAYGARVVAIYFLALAAWRGADTALGGAPAGEVAASAVWMLAAGAVAVGLLALLAWATARAALYTITSRRVALRIGYALTVTLNLPFSRIAAADLRLDRDGTGDIALTLADEDRLGWFILWPHCRPWRLSRPQPSLRCLPGAQAVADLLAGAVAEDASRRAAREAPTLVAAE
jgi:hypothetical protein